MTARPVVREGASRTTGREAEARVGGIEHRAEAGLPAEGAQGDRGVGRRVGWGGGRAPGRGNGIAAFRSEHEPTPKETFETNRSKR